MKNRELFFVVLFFCATSLCVAQIGSPASSVVNLTSRDLGAISVAAGSAGTINFACDPSSLGGDIFDVAVSDPSAPVSLLMPNAVEVTPGNASSLGFSFLSIPDTSSTPTLIPSLFSIPGTHSVFTVPPGQPGGNCTVKVDASAASKTLIVFASYFSSSSVRAALVTDAPLYKVGDAVVFSGLLFDNTSPVTGASVAVKVGIVTDLSSPPAEIILVDSGAVRDAAVGDGIYTGTWAAPTPGNYTAAMQATGTGSSGNFSRTGTATFRVLPLTATFASFADNGADDNGNGLFDRIVVTASANVQLAGNYRFGISLTNGTVVLKGAANAKLSTGSQQIAASFAASDILSLGSNGPYQLTDATLVYLDDPDAPLVDYRASAGNTKAYSLASIEKASIFFTGQNTITPSDTNGNGKYDVLRITAGISVSSPGFYQWSGRLVDPFGHEIDFVSGSASLAAGAGTITFSFSGSKIGQNARNGPYALRSVLFYGPAGSLVVDQLLTTQPYSVLLFESAKCPGDLNNDKATDTLDLNIVRASYGLKNNQPGFNAVADINGDGVVDVRDLSYVAQNVGCKAP